MNLPAENIVGVQQIFMSVSEIDDGNAIAPSRLRSISRMDCSSFVQSTVCFSPGGDLVLKPACLSQHDTPPAAQTQTIPGRLRFSFAPSVRA